MPNQQIEQQRRQIEQPEAQSETVLLGGDIRLLSATALDPILVPIGLQRQENTIRKPGSMVETFAWAGDAPRELSI